MQIINPALALEEYILANKNDSPGSWEYGHGPYIREVISKLTKEQSIEFSSVIWNWSIYHLYELADPILWSNNKYLDITLMYSKIFSRIEEIEKLEYLFENIIISLSKEQFKEWETNFLIAIKNNIERVLAHTNSPIRSGTLNRVLLELEEGIDERERNKQVGEQYRPIILNFIKLIANNEKGPISDIISYPVRRKYPLPSIKCKEDFIIKYDELFDEELKHKIIISDLNIDWIDNKKGLLFNKGDIWLDYDGSIVDVKYYSKVEIKGRERLIENEKESLHSFIREFKEPIHILETSSIRIRIDDFGDKLYRYASWPINNPMNFKPLIFRKGFRLPSGLMGNHKYFFRNKSYLYECFIQVDKYENATDAVLTIYKGEKKISEQKATIVMN